MSKVNVNVGLAGSYKIEAIRPDGTRRLLADWFPNIILNEGLNRIATGAVIDRAVVGTGSAAPAATQTQLANFLAGTTFNAPGHNTTGSSTVGAQADHYAWRRYVFRFNTGVATGNLTEIGVGWGNTTLFSRALILDGNGNPTTITVLADESLDVTYELRFYASLADVNANITISGTTYATVLRASNYPSSWDAALGSGQLLAGLTGVPYGAGALGDVTTAPGGTQLQVTSLVAAQGTYVNNSYQRDIRYTWNISSGNSDITNVLFIHGLGRHKASFSPPLPKRNTNELNLDLRVSWARRP